MSIQFKKAERKQVKLKLAITGPSGSGKTYSALSLAKGLGGKIAVIDTENGSASLYSDKFDFDVIEMNPPFSTDKYSAAIKAAEQAGYEVLVIDSITHAWAGEGGLLEQKEQLDARGKGNSYTNWASITKKHEAFKSEMLHSPVHIITTMRSKQDYQQTEVDGKKVVKKIGLAPVQRDGIEYEFTVVFDVAMNHEAEASKDRTGIFKDTFFKITEDTGKVLKEWLMSGKEPEPVKPQTSPPVKTPPPTEQPREVVNHAPKASQQLGPITEPQIKRAFAMAKALGWNEMDLKGFVFEKTNKISMKDLTPVEYQNVTGEMKVMIDNKTQAPVSDEIPF